MTALSSNFTASKKPKLLDQVRAAIRIKHYSYRTEQSYVQWIKRFILFHIDSNNKGKKVLFFNLSNVFSDNKAKFHINTDMSSINGYASRVSLLGG